MRPLNRSTSHSRIKTSLFSLLLVAGVLIQGVLILGKSWGDLKGVRATLGMPALWRSAYFSQGEKFADYVVFLNENIPPEGRVVLPPSSYGPKLVGNTPSMQFFLAPRQVINCLDVECAANLSPDNTYLLVVDDFPGDTAAQKFGQRLMSNEHWGLLLPPGKGAVSQPAQPGFTRFVDILVAAFLPLLWLGGLSLTGFLLVRSLAPGLPTILQLGLGYGLGLSGLTTSLGLVWLFGAPLVGVTVFWTTGLLLVAGLVIAWFQHKKPASRAQRGIGSLKAEVQDPWLALFILFAGLAAIISAGKGYFSTDEILLWGAKGYGIAATGSLANIQDWGTNTVIYPLHVPLLIAAFKALFGETLPAAKLAFSGYYLALLLSVYSFLVWKGVRRGIAGLATLLLATVPLVFRHATIAYANLPLSFYLVAALIILSACTDREDETIYPQGTHITSSALFLLSGFLFAAAAWTRPEGLWMAALEVLALMLLACYRRRLPAPKGVALLLAPIVAYVAFWMVLKASVYTQQVRQADLVGNAIAHTLAGDLPLDEVAYIIRSLAARLFDPRTWGVIGFVLVLVVLLSIRRGSPRRAEALSLIVAGIVYTAAVIGMYILTTYDTVHDISWWVSTGMERMTLPAMLLLWLGGVLWAEPFDHDKNRPVSTDLEDNRRV